MFVRATDADRGNNGSIVYNIVTDPVIVGHSKQAYFKIDSHTGLIRTDVSPHQLDRETVPLFSLSVRALDEGDPSLSVIAEVTISLSDINDQRPRFRPQTYITSMSERQKSGEVMRVGATDADLDDFAKLTYRLADDRDRIFFQIVSVDNMGSILVYGVRLSLRPCLRGTAIYTPLFTGYGDIYALVYGIRRSLRHCLRGTAIFTPLFTGTAIFSPLLLAVLATFCGILSNWCMSVCAGCFQLNFLCTSFIWLMYIFLSIFIYVYRFVRYDWVNAAASLPLLSVLLLIG